MAEENREMWGSRIGFIMAAAGSAVGLGNVWRFPYLVGMNGGAAFVIVYIIVSVTVGLTILLAEFCIGRATRGNAVSAFKSLTKNPLWRFAGWLGVLAGGFIILSYYSIIAGWTIKYTLHSATGLMDIALAGKSGDVFGEFLLNEKLVIFFQAIAMLITTAVVANGLGKGIERACKVLMPILFVLLLLLIVRAVTLPGAVEGLKFYLLPDFSKITGPAVLDALSQAFFSMSIGMGIMVTYGSYIKSTERLHTSGSFILCIDTAIAFLSGLVIFPAVFAMGVEPSQGVGLTFIALPGVFAQMTGGAIFSTAFFLLLSVAALTSMMSLLEVSVSFLSDEYKYSRKAAAWISGIAITLFGIPSVISLGSGLEIFGMSFFDVMDNVSNRVMIPLAAMGASLFAGWVWHERAKNEITNGGTVPFAAMGLWMIGLRFVAPIAIAVIMVYGWPF